MLEFLLHKNVKGHEVFEEGKERNIMSGNTGSKSQIESVHDVRTRLNPKLF